MEELKLNPYRFFDSDSEIRKIAMQLYSAVKDLPIVCPHGHVDPSYLAENKSYPDPAASMVSRHSLFLRSKPNTF